MPQPPKRKHFKSGSRSLAFKPRRGTGKSYLLDDIPAGLWADVKAKAKREQISIRARILTWFKAWVSEDGSDTTH